MLLVGLLMLTGSALAQGCDAAYVSNCVSAQASLDPSVTLGANVFVGSGAQIGPNVDLADDVFVGARAQILGFDNGVGPFTIGASTYLGRSVVIGRDPHIGELNSWGRKSTTGDDLLAANGVSVGYAVQMGDDIILGSSAILGNLVQLGHSVTIGSGAVLARSTVVQDGAMVNGIVGPGVQIDTGAQVAATARVRKNAHLFPGVIVESGARVGRDVIIEADARISSGAVVGAGARILAGSTVPDDYRVLRDEVYGNACTLGDVACPAASCVDIRDNRPGSVDGAYWIEPDANGALEVWCDVDTAGGGWMLVLNRESPDCCNSSCAPTTPTEYAAGVVTPSTAHDALSNEAWARLRAVSTESLALGQHTGCSVDHQAIATIATLESANCQSLNTDLTSNVIAWNEDSGCTYTGSDYSVWFGVSNAYFSDVSRNSLFAGSSSGGAYLSWALMYVR
ncbi:MAG: UDP-3-O-[3-hydroxymyristoyl] glucosamine N-acyltransferase [Myxococcota bacterium]|jgi:UDP-3-O-[3-hydroxymyristoyl] glucosamine N-acyltransferase